ncbi:UPF0488 protein CG14286 isoform X2 [Hyposmocoma kahamanoa]|uniref:UPF0488 protein CG14286 isoform X2 n=1 Tax=Hyposmocoma kahamanoa TaxID=1477025 RepID=UPI000E6D5E0F|nr:UPF0488 protein CG14286 isoform X2 [Hyposmocoma kahamanoa]
MATAKKTDKQTVFLSVQDAWKVLTILKNNNQPIIRKRQVMRTYFGDYRAAMAVEEKKLPKMISKMKIKEKPTPPKATFLRKSTFMATGNDSFRFNFELAPDQVDKGDVTRTAANADTTNSTNLVSNCGDYQVPKKDFHANESKFNFNGSKFKFNFHIPE